jgi:hypothetical protein
LLVQKSVDVQHVYHSISFSGSRSPASYLRCT